MKNMILGIAFSVFTFLIQLQQEPEINLSESMAQGKEIYSTHSFENRGYVTIPAEVKAVRK